MATSMLVIFLICFSHHVAWRYPFPLPFHWCRGKCTFQSPGETLIATAANLCSAPFPGGLFSPPAFWHLRQDPKNFTIMNAILSFMRKGQKGNSSPDNFHGSSFLFNFSSIPSQISKYLLWLHLAGWQKPMIYEADRSLHYRQLFVNIGPSTALWF